MTKTTPAVRIELIISPELYIVASGINAISVIFVSVKTTT